MQEVKPLLPTSVFTCNSLINPQIFMKEHYSSTLLDTLCW